MASTKLDIFNLAASTAGGKAKIADVDETSREAELCRMWHDETLQALLHAAPWSFAKAHKRLDGETERDVDEDWTNSMPDPGWQFYYDAPSDMIRPRFITTYERFTMSIISGARKIMTQVDDAILVYTKNETTVTLWEPNFVNAMAFALGSRICLPLTGKPERTKQLLEVANREVLLAREGVANEDMERHESVPEWLVARGYNSTAPATRYIYPSGSLLSPVDGVSVR